jgi:hypothetical protein
VNLTPEQQAIGRRNFLKAVAGVPALAGLGAAFVYKPDWLTLYLRSTMTAIETGASALPYPWGDRLEVILRGIGGSVWMQFAFAIVVVRVAVWLIARFIGYCWRRGAR